MEKQQAPGAGSLSLSNPFLSCPFAAEPSPSVAVTTSHQASDPRLCPSSSVASKPEGALHRVPPLPPQPCALWGPRTAHRLLHPCRGLRYRSGGSPEHNSLWDRHCPWKSERAEASRLETEHPSSQREGRRVTGALQGTGAAQPQ